METVEQTRQRIEAFIKERAPTIDLTPGSVLGELLTTWQANVQNEVYNAVASLEQSKAIKDVLASAEDTFSEIIDSIASNYDTYRNEGKRANGQIKVYVSTSKTYFLPEGIKFKQPSLNFEYATVTAYTVSATSTPVQLKQEGSKFYFIIPVEATEVGQDKQVAHGTKFTISNTSTLPEFVDAAAFGAFAEGADTETDRELITRFRLGLSTKTLVTPLAIESVLKDRYPNFRAVSIRSTGDPEEIRGKNNPLGISVPGMVDAYVRMSYASATTTQTLTGNVITSGANTGKWLIEIPATTVPGFYKVLSVVAKASNNAGTENFTSVTYGYDETLYARKNNVTSTEEARFSKYQTCSIVFPYSSPSEAVSADFDVTFSYQPQIAEIQELFLNDQERIPCADYLVKAIVPCEVSIKLKLVKNSNLDVVDANAIKSDVFNYVNSLVIGEPISASKIVDICHNYNIKRVDLPVVMTGKILAPYSTTDEVIYISGTDTLEIPYTPTKGVTSATTAFFMSYFDENENEAIGIEMA